MCFSGSTLDSSVAGPRFEPHCPSRRSSGAAARAKERVGWQPPIVRGLWWGALLQLAGSKSYVYYTLYVGGGNLQQAHEAQHQSFGK